MAALPLNCSVALVTLLDDTSPGVVSDAAVTAPEDVTPAPTVRGPLDDIATAATVPLLVTLPTVNAPLVLTLATAKDPCIVTVLLEFPSTTAFECAPMDTVPAVAPVPALM